MDISIRRDGVLGLSSLGVERPEDVNVSLIKKLNVNCRFSNSFKENINKAEFVPAAKLQKD